MIWSVGWLAAREAKRCRVAVTKDSRKALPSDDAPPAATRRNCGVFSNAAGCRLDSCCRSCRPLLPDIRLITGSPSLFDCLLSSPSITSWLEGSETINTESRALNVDGRVGHQPGKSSFGWAYICILCRRNKLLTRESRSSCQAANVDVTTDHLASGMFDLCWARSARLLRRSYLPCQSPAHCC